MESKIDNSTTIRHYQADDRLITFYAVKRMPNGKLGIAKTTAMEEGLHYTRQDNRQLFAEMILNDLRALFESLEKHPY